jgi:phosphinothricin acetyltransferase
MLTEQIYEGRMGEAMEKIMIRNAAPEDAEEILRIYAYYVEHTAITFEYTVPTVEEFRERIRHTLEKYPYIVAVENDKIVGYAYTGPFRVRIAYAWNVETTVYVDREKKGQGIGRLLYEALEEASKKQHILNMNACIAVPVQEDEYLTDESEQFHAHLGYEMVGKFHASGFKFGRWYDMIWMEKHIGEHTTNPQPVIPYPEATKNQ